jgi:hypothetical protein
LLEGVPKGIKPLPGGPPVFYKGRVNGQPCYFQIQVYLPDPLGFSQDKVTAVFPCDEGGDTLALDTVEPPTPSNLFIPSEFWGLSADMKKFFNYLKYLD